MIEQWWRRDGLALPAVMVIVLFLIIMGMGILELGTLETFEAIKSQNRMRAFYLAEAGAQRALERIANEDNWRNEEGDKFWDEKHELGRGWFKASYDDGDPVTVTSVGKVKVGEQSETVYVTVSPGQKGGGAFSGGVFGARELKLTGSSNIYGYDSRTGQTVDIEKVAGSVDLIKLTGMSTIHGMAGLSDDGEVNVPGSRSEDDAITDGVQYDVEDPPDPVEIPSDLINMPYTQENDPGLDGNYRVRDNDYSMQDSPWSASIDGGDYRFEDFDLQSNAQLQITGHARIYVEGDYSMPGSADINLAEGAKLEVYIGDEGSFSMKGDSSVNTGGSPLDVAVYSASDEDTSLGGNVSFYGGLYAPESYVHLHGSSPVRGGLVADELNLSGNVRIYYDIAMLEKLLPGDPGDGSGGGGQMEIIDWTKRKAWRDYYEQTPE